MASEIEVLVLEGSPRERGRVHGEALKTKALEAVERWKYLLHLLYQRDLNDLIEQFVGGTNFLAAVEKWTPHLLEEVKGIAEGAGLDFNTVFAMQLMDEGGWYLSTVAIPATRRCSSLGCDRDGDRPALLAQNLDWISFIEGLDVLFHIKHPDSSLEALVPSVAGVIGTCGVNNRPVGVCTNALWSSLNSSVDGLPVNFIVRAVLEKADLKEAVGFLHEIQHASGENFMVGDAERVANFECSAGKVVQYVPYEGARRVYHTNHPLVNDDLIFPAKEPRGGGTSHERFNYLEYRLKDPAKSLSVETFKYILSSHEGRVCAHHNYQPAGGYTATSVIYVLFDSPELHLTAGPPCCHEYHRFTF